MGGWWKWSKMDCGNGSTTLWLYQKHRIINFKVVNCTICELQLNKAVTLKKQNMPKFFPYGFHLPFNLFSQIMPCIYISFYSFSPVFPEVLQSYLGWICCHTGGCFSHCAQDQHIPLERHKLLPLTQNIVHLFPLLYCWKTSSLIIKLQSV